MEGLLTIVPLLVSSAFCKGSLVLVVCNGRSAVLLGVCNGRPLLLVLHHSIPSILSFFNEGLFDGDTFFARPSRSIGG